MRRLPNAGYRIKYRTKYRTTYMISIHSAQFGVKIVPMYLGWSI